MRSGTLDRPVLLPRSALARVKGTKTRCQTQDQAASTEGTRDDATKRTLTIVGNLVDDPELRFTPAGQPVAQVPHRQRPRVPGRRRGEWKDGDSLFLSCVVWRQAAENVAESLTRGMRAIVTGRLRQRSYETKEGEKRTVYELEADEVGLCLRNATAKVTKVTRTSRRRTAGQHQGGRGPVGQRRPPAGTRRAAVLACLPPAGWWTPALAPAGAGVLLYRQLAQARNLRGQVQALECHSLSPAALRHLAPRQVRRHPCLPPPLQHRRLDCGSTPRGHREDRRYLPACPAMLRQAQPGRVRNADLRGAEFRMGDQVHQRRAAPGGHGWHGVGPPPPQLVSLQAGPASHPTGSSCPGRAPR